jgi:hypothetical protein
MNAAGSIIAAMVRVNSALAPVLLPEGSRCFLLKRGENTSVFSLVGSELTEGWFIDFDENRSESGLFSYATTDEDFRDDWAQVTHVAYGVPDDDDEIEIYAFAENEKDTIDPTGTSPFFSGRIVKEANERYEIVEAP